MYSFKFHKDAQKDLEGLNGSVRKLFSKKLKQILNDPKIGIDLGNKANMDLSGYKKVYFDNKKARIVYKVIEEKVIIFIVAVGKRSDLEVYKKASDRID